MQAALAQQSTSDDTETEGKQNATTSSAGAASNADVAKSSVDEMGVRRRPRQLHEVSPQTHHSSRNADTLICY